MAKYIFGASEWIYFLRAFVLEMKIDATPTGNVAVLSTYNTGYN